jgi:hypothetical protein
LKTKTNTLLLCLQLIDIITKRKDFVNTPVHNLANLLNPQYLGSDLEDIEKFEAEKCLESLLEFLGKTTEDKNEIYNAFSQFKSKSGMFY